MPWKQLHRVKARKTVSERFRTFVSVLMRQFVTPPEELLNRAESKLHAPPDHGDKSKQPSVQ
jgi:hypothetical protein